MRRWSGLRVLFVTVTLLIPVLVIGLSVASYLVELRHSRITLTESHAIRVIDTMLEANLVLDEQRLQVAKSPYQPFSRESFLKRAARFRELANSPVLRTTARDAALQGRLSQQYERYVRVVLALPTPPQPRQVEAATIVALETVRLVNEIRSGYSASLEGVIASEAEQRELGLTVLLVVDVVVLLLVVAALLLVGRLGREQARAAALEATDRLRNEFVAFAAHELRNPATAIRAGAWLLRQPDLPQEDRARVVEAIGRSADALSRLVLTLLSMGRLEEGRLQLRTRPLLLAGLVRDLLTEMAIYYPDLPDRVQVNLPDEQVLVDPEYLKLVLSNLLDNALKFSPPGSPIAITGEVTEREVITHVRDHGAGVPPQRLPHVFDKYETVGQPPYSARTGTGLGLYMARLLVEAHGGRIWVDSTLGEGTTISFALPRPPLLGGEAPVNRQSDARDKGRRL